MTDHDSVRVPASRTSAHGGAEKKLYHTRLTYTIRSVCMISNDKKN